MLTRCARCIPGLTFIRSKVIDNLRAMPFAPSVGMHEVPRASVGKATGIVPDEDSDAESETDTQINRSSPSSFFLTLPRRTDEQGRNQRSSAI